MKQEIRKVIKEEIEKMLKPVPISYTAAIVEANSEIKKLNQSAYAFGIPDGWKKTYDYHMTISTGNLPFSVKSNIVNKKVKLKIVAIGKNDNAMVFKEEGDMFSRNDVKHITIAFNRSPKMSKDITEWKNVEPFIVDAVIRQVDHNHKVVLGIDLNEIGSEIKAGVFPNNTVSAGASSIFPHVKQD